MTTVILIHSFAPIPGQACIGGFDWAIRGSVAEAGLRDQFSQDSDASHHDYVPGHIHRLIERTLDDSVAGDAITELLEEDLDRIEGGSFDNTPALIAKHDPTPSTEGATA